MAKERAQKEGVEATTLLREGQIREELTKVIPEEDITLVVLGTPAGDSSVFELSALEAFAAELTQETGVNTVIV
jgi:nucleotide-binding universal stress UspA family protein